MTKYKKKKHPGVPEKVLDLLSKKYNIIDIIHFWHYDNDLQTLEQKLSKIIKKKKSFLPDDRIIILHTDTDFYIPQCNVGITLYNFFKIIDKIDMPKYIFLFYTNHFGLENEIKEMCPESNDRPTVIESFIDDLHYNPTEYHNMDANIDSISHNAICMIHLCRTHRNAVYHLLKKFPDEKLLKSFTLNKHD